MIKELLMESFDSQTRLAQLEDGELCELYIERQGCEKLVGNIYTGRVANVLGGMQAAFVDIGLDRNGFLYGGDIHIDKRGLGPDARALEEQLKSLSIKNLVKPGQQLLVQIMKEPGGSKGPRLSQNITLPGRLMVLLPTVGYVGVSRRIESEEEHARLRAIAESIRPEGMGLIVRTAAEGAEEEQLKGDVDYLVRLWKSIKKKAEYSNAPCVIHRDCGLISRSVRDMLLSDVESLTVEGREAYETALYNAGLISPEIAEKVRLYEGDVPLFHLKRIDSQMEKALSRRVWLESGGYIVIDYTEALTVIDVNTGKFVGRHSLSETVFKINCEAVAEIARQLRLRDIGGIIVIDFIDMDSTEQREQLLQLLKKELRRDRSKASVYGITGLGLVEMTRKKVHQPIHTILKRPCPECGGSGWVLTDETVATQARRDLKAVAPGSQAWIIEAHPAVASILEKHGGVSGTRAYVRPDEAMARSKYKISPADESNLPPKTKKLQGDKR
ncbi:MAG: Rne/Rng family ribonuclease [Clostridia bacterium]|nr:Rne/Rng family ribonuclease [Clostridia bacterium]